MWNWSDSILLFFRVVENAAAPCANWCASLFVVRLRRWAKGKGFRSGGRSSSPARSLSPAQLDVLDLAAQTRQLRRRT